MQDLINIFDTHSHYDDPRFDGVREELVASLFDRGISGIIHAAVDFKSSEYGTAAAKSYEKYYAAVGIHPENLYDAQGDYINRLREAALSCKKVVAIGEIGLDYHYEGYDREAQIKVFREQIVLANELSLPIIVHCRDAVGDCMDILRELKPKGVMHCFSGSEETAREVISLGMYIGFTGALTFKNSKKAQRVAQYLPIDRLLLETDCPYMAPEPFRGKTCDSSMIRFTAQKAAELKGMDCAELLVRTRENAQRLFGI